MNNDKQLIWDLLADNYASISHAWGKELLALSQRKNKQAFHDQANQHLAAIMQWPNLERSRAVKTWLSFYNLPLSPKKLAFFNDFHSATNEFVLNNMSKITVYDSKSARPQ